ncbi:hypothetical protein FOL47_001679, partial [Perkinsus chesapeaki]
PCGRFEVVEATGYNEHSDLFFAVRGGMGGNYGAVVSLTFSTFAADRVAVIDTGFFVPKNGSSVEMMHKFVKFTHSGVTGPELFGRGWFLNGAIGLQAQCFCDACGDCTSCNKLLDNLENEVGLVGQGRAEKDFGEAMWMWSRCSGFLPPAGLSHSTEEELLAAMEKCWTFDDKYKGQSFESKSLFFPKNISLEDLSIMQKATEEEVCKRGPCIIQLFFHGHAALSQPHNCNEVAGSCTSFDHRSPGWMSHFLIYLPDTEADVGVKRWLRELYNKVFPQSLGTSYQNINDLDLAAGRKWVPQYFPNEFTFPRLQRVKCRYNRIDMFSFPAIDKMTVEINDNVCGCNY